MNLHSDVVDEGEAISDEEKEAGHIPRVKKGAGWYGRPHPITVRKKGLCMLFVDGGGRPARAGGRLPNVGSVVVRQWTGRSAYL